MYELEDKVYNAVFALTDEYRKLFCINKCKENNVLYILKEKGEQGAPLFFEDQIEEGDDAETFHTFMPIWCHPRFVEYFLEHGNSETKDNYEVIEMRLDLFKDQWVETLKANRVALAILPLEQDKDFCIEEADAFTKSDAELTS